MPETENRCPICRGLPDWLVEAPANVRRLRAGGFALAEIRESLSDQCAAYIDALLRAAEAERRDKEEQRAETERTAGPTSL